MTTAQLLIEGYLSSEKAIKILYIIYYIMYI